jgi:Domain of unknown function (DUF4390)
MIITTASISRCWRKPRKRGARAPARLLAWFPSLLLVALFLIAGQPQTARAEGASVQSASLEATDEGYQLTADLDLQLSPSLMEAVRKGVPLYFVFEFELTKNRWYWLDQKIATASRERRVSFAPLTDEYRVSIASRSQNVASADDVRRLLSRIRSWIVIEKGRLKPGETYDAALRVRLDSSQLPKPFQLNVMASKEWNLSSDWYRWTVRGGDKP